MVLANFALVAKFSRNIVPPALYGRRHVFLLHNVARVIMRIFIALAVAKLVRALIRRISQVHGHGLIRERNISTGETVEFEVSGDTIEAVYMIPGWTHSIINLSDTEDLVTVMTCNEIFDPNKPDTFFEPV